MRIHRSAHERNFIVLPNAAVQDRWLSYTARGLLADLLSRPDGWSEDAQQMADTSPQGRGAIRKALNELKDAGYYLVVKVRMLDGTIRSEAHVYDIPQRPGAEIIPQPATEKPGPKPVRPGAPRPASGGSASGGREGLPVKDREKEPSLPEAPVDGDREPAPGRPEGREGGQAAAKKKTETAEQPDERTRSAAVALYRVLKAEPRLRLGGAEALELAPLVAGWLEAGCGPAELAAALLPGLPARIHSPAAVVRDRLVRKMPPAQGQEQPPAARLHECGQCNAPVPQAGICRTCAGLGPRPVRIGEGAPVTAAGAARARAAMRSGRQAATATARGHSTLTR